MTISPSLAIQCPMLSAGLVSSVNAFTAVRIEHKNSITMIRSFTRIVITFISSPQPARCSPRRSTNTNRKDHLPEKTGAVIPVTDQHGQNNECPNHRAKFRPRVRNQLSTYSSSSPRPLYFRIALMAFAYSSSEFLYSSPASQSLPAAVCFPSSFFFEVVFVVASFRKWVVSALDAVPSRSRFSTSFIARLIM